jgi:ubiquinone/menaquinone biosynthesis C-methylase UbiE
MELTMHESIFKKFLNLNDADWADLLFKSVDSQIIDGVKFPGFPAEDIQLGMIGSSGKNALYEPKTMYQEIRRIAVQQNKPFDEKTTLLDFACGFGRNVRFFMKDIYPGNLYASDVRSDLAIDLCGSTFSSDGEIGKEIKFDVNTPFPPLKYKKETFDIIMAYSLFSHLSEEACTAWLKEFSRVLKKGGLIFVTIRQQNFLTSLKNNSSADNVISDYERMLREKLGNPTVQQRFDNGDFIFNPTGGGSELSNDFYGDTVIPDKYIYRRWVEWFDIIEHYDDAAKLGQAFICLRKKRQGINKFFYLFKKGILSIKRNGITETFKKVMSYKKSKAGY